jgi:hypothetical protein
MKNLLYALLPMLFLALTFNACQKDPVTTPDPCDNVSCFNGGICQSGTCDCPPGYSGSQCQISDPCYNITCFNGGTCANGTCNCPPGYGGSDCSTVLTPVSMTITRVTVTDYPLTKSNGGGWDLTTGPDCFITINSGTSSNQNTFVSGFTYTNATGSDMQYNTGFPATIGTPNSTWSIGLWDDDSPDSDDFMAGIYFTPNSYNSGFPSSFTLNTSDLTVVFNVTWNF